MKTCIPGFKITDKKGFHITFENGWTVSVQFGPGNYCENYNLKIYYENAIAGEKGSSNAECAVWGPDGEMIKYGDWEDKVSNRSTPVQVLKLLNWASRQKLTHKP